MKEEEYPMERHLFGWKKFYMEFYKIIKELKKLGQNLEQHRLEKKEKELVNKTLTFQEQEEFRNRLLREQKKVLQQIKNGRENKENG